MIELPRHHPPVLEIQGLTQASDGLMSVMWTSGPDWGRTAMSPRTRVQVLRRPGL